MCRVERLSRLVTQPTAGSGGAFAESHFQQHPRRVFDRFFDALEERDGLAAVDEAVVVGEGDVHHRADDDLAFAGDGAVLNGVHAEDAALGRIDDRRREERAEDAAVGDRERAAFEVVGLELVVRGRAAAKSSIACSISAKLSRSANAQHGHDQALRAADGDADVVVVAVDDVRAADFGIQLPAVP